MVGVVKRQSYFKTKKLLNNLVFYNFWNIFASDILNKNEE